MKYFSFFCLLLCGCEVNHYDAHSVTGNSVHEDNYQLGGTRSAKRSDGSSYANDYQTSFRDFMNFVTALAAAYFAGDVQKAMEITKQMQAAGLTKQQIAAVQSQAQIAALKPTIL